MNCFNENRIQKLETEVPNIQQQLLTDHLNPDITGTFGLFREWAMLSGKITQFMNSQNILYSDKEIEYAEPQKLADDDSFQYAVVATKDDNLDPQSKEVNSSTTDTLLGIDDFLVLKSHLSENVDNTVKSNNNWVSRCGIFCSACKKKYPNKPDFDSHYLQTHIRSEILYTCSLCNEEDVNYNRFRNHCYRHFAKGRIKCSQCPTIRFTQDKHLQAHNILFHSENPTESLAPQPQTTDLVPKPPGRKNIPDADPSALGHKTDIFCGKCKQKYIGKKFFDKHFRTKHPHSEIIYSCTICKDAFQDFEAFKNHSNSQHDKFSCSNCSAKFKKKVFLSEHMKSDHHQGTEPDSSVSELNIKECAMQHDHSEFDDTKNIVQKSNSNVDIKNCTNNIDNCVNLENISDIFSSDENQNIDLQMKNIMRPGFYKKDMKEHTFAIKVEKESWACSQSVISESDISDLISNVEDVNGLDEINNWRNHIGILCGRCSQKFSAKNMFDDHYLDEHKTTVIIYTCPLCKSEYENYNRFRDHCYRHFIKGRFKCCYCSNRFPKLNRLSAHIKSLHPESYQAEGLLLDQIVDSKSVSGSVDLNWRPPSIQSNYSSDVKSECQSVKAENFKGHKHLNSWLTRYGIFCCKCKMKLLDKASFQSHYLEKHSETNIIYTCSLCSQEYDSYKCFSNHCLRHFNRDSYKCKLCCRSFAKYRSLSAHIKEIHSANSQDIISFVCKLCNKVYLTQDRLNQHTISCGHSDASSVTSSHKHSPTKSEVSQGSSMENFTDSSNSTAKSDFFLLHSDDKNSSILSSSCDVLTDRSLEIYNSKCNTGRDDKTTGENDRKSFNWLHLHGILCVKCKQKFPGRKFIDAHFQKVHPQNEVIYTCSVCTEQFKHYRSFLSHAYRHFVRGRIKCQYCPLLFSHNNQYQAHLKAFATDKRHIVGAIQININLDEQNDEIVTPECLPADKSEDILADENHNNCINVNDFNISFYNALNTENISRKIDSISQTEEKLDIKKDNNEEELQAIQEIKSGDINELKKSSLEILCHLCKEKYPDKCAFDEHFNAKHSGWHPIYACPTCERIDHIYSNFTQHKCNRFNLFRSYPRTKIDDWMRYAILCRKCNLKFINKYFFRKHYQESHSKCKPVYSCSLCQKDCENYENFRSHRYLHYVKGKFKCRFCPMSFAKYCRLVRHHAKTHPDIKQPERTTSLSCSTCYQIFSADSDLNIHLLVCPSQNSELAFEGREEMINCTLCGEDFKHFADYQDHNCFEIKHEMCLSPGDVFSCWTCDDVFHSIDQLQIHSALCFQHHKEANGQTNVTLAPETEGEHNILFETETNSSILNLDESQSALIHQFVNNPHKDYDEFFSEYLGDGIVSSAQDSNSNSNSNRIKCGKCKLLFPSKVLFDRHLAQEHSGCEVVYTCAVCDREYKTYHSFRNHHYRHKGRYKCSMCPSRFSIRSSLSVHMVHHHFSDGLLHPCHLCDKAYHTEPGLKLHIRNRHTDSNCTFTCKLCGIVLHSKNGFLLHMKSHKVGMQFMCHVCGQHFKQKTNLFQHLHNTHRLRQLACHHCPKSFSRKSHLAKHVGRHTQSRKQCEVCKRWYRNEYCLKKHSLVHVERPYACNTCGKRFLTSAKLRQHTNIHTGQKPHQCTYCFKAFTNSSNLLKHNKRQHKREMKKVLTLEPSNVTDEDPSLYDKNWMQPATTALDDSIQSVIITSENFKHSVINKKSYEVKNRNKDIVRCNKLRTESSPRLAVHLRISDSELDDSIRLYSQITENTFSEVGQYYPDTGVDLQLGQDDILPRDGLPTVNLRDITLHIPNRNKRFTQECVEIQQNTESSSDQLYVPQLLSPIDSLPIYWSDGNPTTNEEANTLLNQPESSNQIELFQREIIKELAEKVDFLEGEESPPNIDVNDEIETEEILSRNISIQDQESSHCHIEQDENNHAFHLYSKHLDMVVPFAADALSTIDGPVSGLGLFQEPHISPQTPLDANDPMLHSTEHLSSYATKQSAVNRDTSEFPWGDTINDILTINVNLSTSPVIDIHNANDLNCSIHYDVPDDTSYNPSSPLPLTTLDNPELFYQQAPYLADQVRVEKVNHAMPNQIDQRIVNRSPLLCTQLAGVDFDCFIDNLDFGSHFK